MSDYLVLDDSLWWRASRWMHDRVLSHLRHELQGDPEVNAVFQKEEIWNAQDAWYFTDLSLDALRRMRSALIGLSGQLPDMLRTLPGADVREENQSSFNELMRLLDTRIARLESEGVTRHGA